tara:strand:- start:328 stop:501 length:174 start_codon:yes stop_codon:yes gene_type:complete
MARVFEGRHTWGTDATIKRFVEHLMPAHARAVALGIPAAAEFKYWCRDYEQCVALGT